MNKNAIVMAAVIRIVAAGTYYGLELIAGKPKPEAPATAEAPEAPEVTADDAFPTETTESPLSLIHI